MMLMKLRMRYLLIRPAVIAYTGAVTPIEEFCMGWSINVVSNTLEITPECAAELYDVGDDEYFFGDPDAVTNRKGLLSFDPDSMEHMDYLWDERIQAVLCKHQVNGKVVFSSTEGDNRDTWWSYDFVDGVCTQATGKLSGLFK